jgi:hypothetical protein
MTLALYQEWAAHRAACADAASSGAAAPRPLRQLFVTASQTLLSQVEAGFRRLQWPALTPDERRLRSAAAAAGRGAATGAGAAVGSLVGLPEGAWPLFVSGRQLLRLLDDAREGARRPSPQPASRCACAAPGAAALTCARRAAARVCTCTGHPCRPPSPGARRFPNNHARRAPPLCRAQRRSCARGTESTPTTAETRTCCAGCRRARRPRARTCGAATARRRYQAQGRLHLRSRAGASPFGAPPLAACPPPLPGRTLAHQEAADAGDPRADEGSERQPSAPPAAGHAPRRARRGAAAAPAGRAMLSHDAFASLVWPKLAAQAAKALPPGAPPLGPTLVFQEIMSFLRVRGAGIACVGVCLCLCLCVRVCLYACVVVCDYVCLRVCVHM